MRRPKVTNGLLMCQGCVKAIFNVRHCVVVVWTVESGEAPSFRGGTINVKRGSLRIHSKSGSESAQSGLNFSSLAAFLKLSRAFSVLPNTDSIQARLYHSSGLTKASTCSAYVRELAS